MSRFSELELSVLATLAYCDQFGYALTAAEVCQRLIPVAVIHQVFPSFRTAASSTHHPHSFFSIKHCEAALHSLIKKKKVISDKQFYALHDHQKNFSRRREREQIFQERKRELTILVRWAKRLSWVDAIFLTGSFAMSNGDKDDDMDLMIVTRHKRMWLSRALFIALALWYGKRRSWRGEEKKSWCFNLWVDRENLGLDPSAQNVYHAYEVIQAKPLYDVGGTATLFYQKNRWVETYLPQWEVPPSTQKRRRPPQPFLIVQLFFDLLDWLMWQAQSLYMLPHRTSEKVGRGYAFFHPRDTKSLLLNTWKKILLQYTHDVTT